MGSVNLALKNILKYDGESDPFTFINNFQIIFNTSVEPEQESYFIKMIVATKLTGREFQALKYWFFYIEPHGPI